MDAQDHPDASELVDAKNAAAHIGVSGARVRALVASGDLPAKKVGQRWLLRRADVEDWKRARHISGRPLSPSNAWALLRLASGLPADSLRPDVRARLRRRLRRSRLDDQIEKLRRRAKVHYFRAPWSAIMAVRKIPQFVRSGISAAADYGFDIKPNDVLEGYLPRQNVERLSYRYALRPVDEARANLIIRVPTAQWPFDASAVAPSAVVAADLLESKDARTRRAALRMVRHQFNG